MPTFKDFIELDNATFFNENEFAETHNLDGRSVKVLVDNDRLQHRSKVEYEGVIVGDILYYVDSNDMPKIPKVDDMQRFDNAYCTVFDVRKDKGVYEIILKKNVS